MRIEDRIQNIKKLLEYCPKSSDEVMLTPDDWYESSIKHFKIKL